MLQLLTKVWPTFFMWLAVWMGEAEEIPGRLTLRKKTGHNQKILLWKRTPADGEKGMAGCFNNWPPKCSNCFLQQRKAHVGFWKTEWKAGSKFAVAWVCWSVSTQGRGTHWMRALTAETEPWKVSRKEFRSLYPISHPLRGGRDPLWEVSVRN